MGDDLRASLDQDALQAAAGQSWTIRLYDAVDSTNAVAAAAPEPDLVVVGDHQQAGRGRLDRVWVTPEGAALTMTAVVDPGVEDQWWPLVPLVAGCAVARATDATLKWPNDVLLEDKKVCGILVERIQADGHPLALVGIGINVSQTREELPVETATSLLLAGRDADRTALLGSVLGELRSWLAVLARSPHELVDHYRRLCSTLGQAVRVDLPDGLALTGTAEDVDAYGRLVVDGTAVAAGDVVHVRPAAEA